MPVALAIVDIEGNYIANLELRARRQQVIANHDAIFIFGNKPSSGSNHRFDQAGIRRWSQKLNLGRSGTILGKNLAYAGNPAFHRDHSGNTARHGNKPLGAIELRKSHIHI